MLSGGASSRMNSDKGSKIYHQKPQFEYLYELLVPYCNQVFISGRKKIDYQLPVIHDNPKFENYGPLAGLLSAFEKQPTTWLVLAVDYPMIGTVDIIHLINTYDITYDGAVYFDFEKQFFEPFLGIYSPKLLKYILNHAAQYHFSAQKILFHEIIQKVKPLHENSLLNINTEEAYKAFIRNGIK